MEKLVKEVVNILPVSVLLLVFLFLSFNLYLKIRRSFPVKVNCWFCNAWTRVAYDDQNCFDCPNCLQYNGFDSSGDYNRVISAQHDKLLNKDICKPTKAKPSSNGLCEICNNNQQLKIFQLANFVPLRHKEYDIEIEHFQKQLEKAYKLCRKCEKVVKATIGKQNSLLGLNFSKIRNKTFSVLDLNTSSNGITKHAKLNFLKNSTYFILFIFAILNLSCVIYSLDLKYLEQFAPNWSKNFYVELCMSATYYYLYFMKISNLDKFLTDAKVDLVQTWDKSFNYFDATLPNFQQIVQPYVRSIQVPAYLENNVLDGLDKSTFLLGFVGTLLQFMSFFLSDNRNLRNKIIQFIAWNVVAISYWIPLSVLDISKYLNAIQITASVIIIYTMCSSGSKASKKHVLKRLKRRPKLVVEEDYSDTEEPIEKLSTFRKSTSKLDFSHNQQFPSIPQPVFGQSPIFESSLLPRISPGKNFNAFLTARSVNDVTSLEDSLFSDSKQSKSLESFDINEVLDKLHLGTSSVKRSSFINVSPTSKSRPILSPPKLKNVTQNSWVAGGFWLDSNGVPFPTNNFANCSALSRSSSQTSGFVSQSGQNDQTNFNPFQSSQNNSICGDHESVVSEPAYSFSGHSNYNSNKNLFSNFPIINHEHYVYVAPSVASCSLANRSFVPISNENLRVSAFRTPVNGELTKLFK